MNIDKLINKIKDNTFVDSAGNDPLIDNFGHGTAVASIIATKTNNNLGIVIM